jgi:hypothetical protein
MLFSTLVQYSRALYTVKLLNLFWFLANFLFTVSRAFVHLMLCEFALVLFFLPKKIAQTSIKFLGILKSTAWLRRRLPCVRWESWPAANLIKKVQARNFFKLSVGECCAGDRGVYLFARQMILCPKDGRSHSFVRSPVSFRSSFALSVIGILRLENSRNEDLVLRIRTLVVS